MKKLLALILCVVLIVGALPASASAITTREAMEQAYAAMDDLGWAYSAFAAASAVAMQPGMFSPSRFSLKDNPNALIESEIIQYVIRLFADLDMMMILENGGHLSYKGMFASGFGGDLYYMYFENLGAAVGYDVALKEAEITAKTIDAYTEKVDEVVAAANAAEQALIDALQVEIR